MLLILTVYSLIIYLSSYTLKQVDVYHLKTRQYISETPYIYCEYTLTSCE